MDKESPGQKMHKDFFDRCREAIEMEYYLEAIFMEYAAIESRMEVLLGVLGLPCNKFLDGKDRKSVQISHRIHCAKIIFKQSGAFKNTKLEAKYFDKLGSWINKRNIYIHGLYKNEFQYKGRKSNAKVLAEQGEKICKDLYNEVNRLKRLRKRQPEIFDKLIDCHSSSCNLHSQNKYDCEKA